VRRKNDQLLARLADYAGAHGIRTYLAMTPDVHNLTDCKLGFVHDIIRGIAREYGYAYIDLLPRCLAVRCRSCGRCRETPTRTRWGTS
jgi:hypothetical protein